MRQVNVTELRNHLPAYLGRVQSGEEIQITSRGKVIAMMVPGRDRRAEARERLAELRMKCRVGDVTSPLAEEWDAARDHS